MDGLAGPRPFGDEAFGQQGAVIFEPGLVEDLPELSHQSFGAHTMPILLERPEQTPKPGVCSLVLNRRS